MSPKSQQQREAADKYLKDKVDTIVTRVPKGRKAVVQAHAEARRESVNGFVNRAISETMERDNTAPGASEGRTEGNNEAGELSPAFPIHPRQLL